MTKPTKPSNPPRRGKVASVRGSIVDVTFPKPLPALFNLLLAGDDGQVRMEVLSHIDGSTVRGIALVPTQGLSRGAPVTDTGGPLKVPVGRECLGRMFNVFGETLDGKGEVKGEAMRGQTRRVGTRAP